MQPKLPHPEHYSYQQHRQQRNWQILFPVLASVVVVLLLVIWISYATFNTGGDVSRWAAVSTIWLSIPVLLGGLIVLALLGGLIYGLSRALDAIPYYTGIAQDYVYIARGYIVRGADAVSGMVIKVEEQIAHLKSFLQRIVP